MKKHLIAIDLDGTALYDMYTITDLTVNTIMRVKELGHEVVISTGRSFESTEKFYHILKLNTPLINYNGGLVTNPTDKTFRPRESFIPKDIIIDILKDNKSIITNYIISNDDEFYVLKEDIFVKDNFDDYKSNKIITGDITSALKTNPHGFTAKIKPNSYKELEKNIKDSYGNKINIRGLLEYNNEIVEITNGIHDKGDALVYVAKYLGFDMKDVIAFGDADNDTGMIKAAGIGVAMENAYDEVKEVADDFALHHQKDGVAKYLIKFFNL